MERKELIELLIKKANVSYKEAEEALEKSNWDLLEAIEYLENRAKGESTEKAVIINVSNESNGYKEESNGNDSEKSDTFGKLFKFIGKIIKKGNDNYLVIKRKGEKLIKLSLTISAILTVFAFWAVAILLVVGLFFEFKYSIVGPNIKGDKVNDIFGKASDTAENIKREFQEGYKNA